MRIKLVLGGGGKSYLLSSIPSLISPEGGINRLGDVDG